MSHLSTKKIVITGAPGTGKTVIVEELERQGYHCYHEIIRSMTAAAKKNGKSKEMVSNPLVFVDDPLLFNKKLLDGRTKHFLESTKLEERICFFDRGIPDVLAYMDYFGQEYPNEFKKVSKAYLYDIVFILPPWEKIYVSDNERMETFKEAQELHGHLMETYQSLGHEIIVVPKTTIEKRVSFILDNID